MRVLWPIRENLTQHTGGDTIQILQTAEALSALGVDVVTCADKRPDFAGFDVVHLFHLDRLWENAAHARRIVAAKRPAVLSPIYWPTDAFDRGGRAGVQGWLARTVGSGRYRDLRLAQRWLLDAVRTSPKHWNRPVWRFDAGVRTCLRAVSVLLPNSTAEQQVIESILGDTRPHVVVPNGVHPRFAPGDRPWPEGRQGALCVGRLEPRKNQLSLIRALADTDISLTLVGRTGRFNAAYGRRCRREASANVRFVDHCSPDELVSWYRSSLVHVCPSWYETPGLCSLEAAASGCAIVVTPGGCTREYFGEEAEYCRPDDAASIADAVRKALDGGPGDALGGRVRREFTWERAARQTLRAYELALAS